MKSALTRTRRLSAVTADVGAAVLAVPGISAPQGVSPVPKAAGSIGMVPGAGNADLSTFLALSMAPLVNATHGSQLVLDGPGQN